MNALTELETSLYLSWLLAKAHQAVGKPSLKWNPRSYDDLLAAGQKLLQYIDQDLFPVHQIYNEDADGVWDALTAIPIRPLGYDMFDDGESFMECAPETMWRLCLTLVYLFEMDSGDVWAYYAYAELRNTWQIEKPAPPWAIADWIETHGDEIETKIEHGLGLVYFLRYVTNSTGHQFLDYTASMMGESGTRLEWNAQTITDLTNQWKPAAVYEKTIDAFLAWSRKERNWELARAVVRQASQAVIAAQDDKNRWNLQQLEMAYNRLEGRTDDVDEREVAVALGDWERVLDIAGDGSEEWEDEEE